LFNRHAVEGASGQGVLGFKLDIVVNPWTAGREFIGFNFGEGITAGLEVRG